MRHFSLFLVFITILVATAITALGATPNLINYEGRITTASGDPVPDGNYLIQLRIYDAAAHGNTLWDNGYRSIALTKGLFSYLLGDSVPLPANLFTSGSQRWLGIKVGTDGEITPRMQLVSSPYSQSADYAGRADTANWSTLVGMPAGFADGVDNNTTYSAGSGLQLGAGVFSLAANGVTAANIADEPGVAGNLNTGSYTLNTTAMQDLATVTITLPASGYVMLHGQCRAVIYGTTASNYAWIQIDETSGGSYVFPYFTGAGAENFPDVGQHQYPMFVQRVYFKAAGTYTFRLEGRCNSTNGTTSATCPILTALYVPTSYGTVNSASSTPSGLDGERVERTLGPDGKPTSVYVGDLRQLELQANKAALEAEQAQRKALEAQLRLERAKTEAGSEGK